jgi:uncharacterized SAM-binding protein YcdF (DUF218 family)
VFKKIALFTLFLLVCVYIFLIYAGRFLVIDNPPKKADAIFLFLGGNRETKVVELIKQTLAPIVVLSQVNNNRQPVAIIGGSTIWANTALSVNRLRKAAIPDSNIVVLQTNVVNTADEAHAFVQYLKQNPTIKTVIVVSSTYHMRRVKLCLSTLGNKEKLNIEYVFCPSTKQKFNPAGWWKSPQCREFVKFEYLKIFHFLFVDQYRFG